MLTKALCLTHYGSNIHNCTSFIEIEIQKPGANQVLIEIKAAAINPIDYKIVKGVARILHRPKRPFPLGFDLSGVIIEIGTEVTDFCLGDEVYSKVGWSQMGTISTYLTVQDDMVALKPKNLSFNEAAAMPLVGCTVLESFKIAGLKKDLKILIHAGSGGIGTFAIQYAKSLGAYVFATTSTSNVNLLKNLGADRVIDYTHENYKKIALGVDVVYDTLGGKYTNEAVDIVKKGGKIISICGHYDRQTLIKLGIPKVFILLIGLKNYYLNYKMRKKNIFYKHVWSYPNKEVLNTMTTLIESEKIMPVIDKVFPFLNAKEALCYLQTNRAKGKVIISME